MGIIKDIMRARVLERDGYKCLKCGTEQNLTVDHIVPKSKGGKNSFSNYQTLCRSCNQKKGNKIQDLRGLKIVGKIELPAAKPIRRKILYSEKLPEKHKAKIVRKNAGVVLVKEKKRLPVEVWSAALKKKYPHAYSLVPDYMWRWIYDNLISKD